MTPQAHDRALEAMLANCTDTDYNDKEDLQGGLDYLRFISDSFMKKDVTFLLVAYPNPLCFRFVVEAKG